MKSRYAFLVILVIGLTIGAALTTVLQAQSTLPAYVVAEVAIHDTDAFARGYAPRIAGTLQPYGGRILTSGKLTTLEGTARPRFVIIAFDSVESARLVRFAWLSTPSGNSTEGGNIDPVHR